MPMKYPFPTKPASLQEAFEKLCSPIPKSGVEQLQQKVSARVQQIKADASNELIGPNTQMADAIGSTLTKLLSSYDQYEEDDQALIAGAVFYFLAERDATHDTTPIVGFDDDARILNNVLERIGWKGEYLSVG